MLRAIDKTMETQGFKIIILMRFSILVPFSVSNYVLGASSVNISHFIIGNFGLIPMALFYVYLGTTMENI